MTARGQRTAPWRRVALYWHTLRYLSGAQILWRIRRRLRPVRPRAVRGEREQPRPDAWVRPVPRPAGWQGATRWSCHGLSFEVPAGRPWLPSGINALDLFHLHYLDDVAGAAAQQDPAQLGWLVERWINDNRLAPREAWHPYPISRRLVNLVKWWLAGGLADAAFIASVAAQADVLERCPEYDLRANHLIANGVALVFAGELLDGPVGRRCRLLGLQILRREVARQVLADGGYYERSPMYHAVVLEDLLDVINVLGGADAAPAQFLVGVAGRMLAWLCAMTMPDGRIALFNDAAFDGCRPTAELVNYAARLGLAVPPGARMSGTALLAESGYARVTRGPWTLIADVGPVGPDEQAGHAHADTLSFELALGQVRLIVDPGTSTYAAGTARATERGTAAHNTLTIDGTDSSEVWATFRTARRARVDRLRLQEAAGEVAIGARHDGYRRLRSPVLHAREWLVTPAGVTIADRLDGRGQHDVALSLLCAPGVAVVREHGGACMMKLGQRRIRLHLPPQLDVRVEQSTWAPEFGRRLPATRIHATARLQLPVELSTVLEEVA